MAYRVSVTVKLYWKAYWVDISDILFEFIGLEKKKHNKALTPRKWIKQQDYIAPYNTL